MSLLTVDGAGVLEHLLEGISDVIVLGFFHFERGSVLQEINNKRN